MSKFGWRLLLVVCFVPLGLGQIVTLIPVLIAAVFAWLLFGPDERDGIDRFDRWMKSAPVLYTFAPLDVLMAKAGVRSEFWT